MRSCRPLSILTRLQCLTSFHAHLQLESVQFHNCTVSVYNFLMDFYRYRYHHHTYQHLADVNSIHSSCQVKGSHKSAASGVNVTLWVSQQRLMTQTMAEKQKLINQLAVLAVFPSRKVVSCFPNDLFGTPLCVSGNLPTYPSPQLTFCPKWEVSVNVGLGEG